MPITPEEFKRGETRGSWEDLAYNMLGDGKAHTLSEIEKEIGIGEKNIKLPPNATDEQKMITLLNALSNVLDSWNFEQKLDAMEKEGRIMSRYIKDKNGKTNKYYIRTDFYK